MAPCSSAKRDQQPLHTTESVCSTCLKPVAAEIIEDESGIWLVKQCEEHGREKVLESRTREFYHITKPADHRSAHRLHHSLKVISTEPAGPSCVALIEITDRCNLECPLCFANSGPGGGFFMSLEEFSARIEALIRRKGPLDILMISGGEPTVHPQLGAMLALAAANPNIKHILVNTNGIRLSKDTELQGHLLAAYDKLEVYLQFDSLNAQTVAALRGAEHILTVKQASLSWLRAKRVATTFAVTLSREHSIEEVGGLIRFALTQQQVRGIAFQPAFVSGRHVPSFDPNTRITTPEVVDLVCAACPDIFTRESFTNLPCSHPNCAIVSYFLRAGGTLWPISSQGTPDERLKNRLRFTLEDISRCGCETTEVGTFIAQTELSPENSFRIIIKPFMDRFSLNRDRSSQCCTHVVGPNGVAMSFCEYNIFRASLAWNRNGDGA